jgi:hypothetical protein
VGDLDSAGDLFIAGRPSAFPNSIERGDGARSRCATAIVLAKVSLHDLKGSRKLRTERLVGANDLLCLRNELLGAVGLGKTERTTSHLNFRIRNQGATGALNR